MLSLWCVVDARCMVIMTETGPNCSFRSSWERSPGKGVGKRGRGGVGLFLQL